LLAALALLGLIALAMAAVAGRASWLLSRPRLPSWPPPVAGANGAARANG